MEKVPEIKIFIQARMGSTRFPGKVMADLCGLPVLQLVVHQCGNTGFNVFILTSELSEDDVIEEYAGKTRVKCIRIGNKPVEVFHWFQNALEQFPCDYVFRVCGDSPFILPAFFNELIKQIDSEHWYFSHRVDGKPAILSLYGIFPELIKADYFKRGEPSSQYMEHVTPPLYQDMHELCKWIDVDIKDNWKLSIDTLVDLERAKYFVQASNFTMPFDLHDIKMVMWKYPELLTSERFQKYSWLEEL